MSPPHAQDIRTYAGKLRAQPAIGTPSNTQVRQSTSRALQPALALAPPSDHETERASYARGRATERTSYNPKKKKIYKSQAQAWRPRWSTWVCTRGRPPSLALWASLWTRQRRTSPSRCATSGGRADLRRAVLHKRAELLQARRAASALVAAGGAGADEDDRLDRKRHNVTINAKRSALAAVCCLMYHV
jgi:hypothetical protein